MNKFIEYDIHNGITQIRCAIMNILDSLNKHEIHHYDFGIYISRTLIEECMGQCGWIIEEIIPLETYKRYPISYYSLNFLHYSN